MRFALATPVRPTLLLLVTLMLVPAMASASGARKGVDAKPGEIVLLRDVSARHAVRPKPPGMALIVNPSPKDTIDQTLGTGELSDAEYAAIGGGSPAGPTPAIAQVTGRALAPLGGTNGGGGAVAGSGIGQALGVPMGALGNVTRGVGDQVRGALAQFPMVSHSSVTTPPGG